MSDTTTVWAKFRDDPHLSWHIVGGMRFGATRCGHWIPESGPSVDELPMGEKSCESCARLTLHDQEKAAR